MKTANAPATAPKIALRVDFGCAVVLAVAVALAWCVVERRWSVEAWQTPAEYGLVETQCDAQCQLAVVHAVAEGTYVPLASKSFPRLNAPFGATWDDFPWNEELHSYGLGLLARALGLFAACNLGTCLLHVAAATGFYAACRLQHAHRLWAFVGGLAFGLSRFVFAHGFHHLSVAAVWHIPLALAACRWATLGSGLTIGERRWLAAVAIGFVTGLQNVYYTNILAQLFCGAALYQAIRHGRRPAAAALSVVAAMALGFLLINADTLLYRYRAGPNPKAVERRYAQMDTYSLKGVDLVVPPPDHRLPVFAAWGDRLSAESLLSGEDPPPAYLGIIGLLAAGAMAVVTVVNLARDPPRAPPLEAVQFAWVFCYATVGGLNSLAGSLGFLLFRSGQRYAVVLAALALMFCVRVLSERITVVRLRDVAAAIFGSLLILWDQTPVMTSAEQLHEVAAAVESDRAFVEELERRLPPNATVFQLPQIDFPESPTYPGIPAYDHFRLYVHSTQLRFSFGGMKGRGFEAWQAAALGGTVPQCIEQLERYGFAALCVDRRMFHDGGAAEFLAEFAAAGRNQVLVDPAGRLFCILLRPSPQPQRPPVE